MVSCRCSIDIPCERKDGPVKSLSMVPALTIAAALAVSAVASCGGGSGSREDRERTLTVFHAGSLSVPMKEISRMFMEENPGVRVLLEAAGSRTSARKISDLGRRCDVMASADYTVIDELLIPGHASWNIKFAANEMAVVFSERSKRSGEMTAGNWFDILLDPGVTFGRSDPDSDPCGYRTVLTMRLAERHYSAEGLADRMLAKDRRFIRPKETDLLALLETGTIDYIFLYRSVAVQHGLPFLRLPGEINLGDPLLSDSYGEASVEISGRAPGEIIVKRGEPMVYGMTIPLNAPYPELAARFVGFMLDAEKGMKVMEEAGQPSLVPSPSDSWVAIPGSLRKYALPTGQDHD